MAKEYQLRICTVENLLKLHHDLAERGLRMSSDFLSAVKLSKIIKMLFKPLKSTR